jgi:hypothetical protein
MKGAWPVHVDLVSHTADASMTDHEALGQSASSRERAAGKLTLTLAFGVSPRA